MTPEQFEQNRRELARKWCPWQETTIFLHKDGEVHPFKNMLSDLDTLLAEYKEMILREELIAYDKWLLKHDLGYDFESTEQCVDEYLKTVNQ